MKKKVLIFIVLVLKALKLTNPDYQDFKNHLGDEFYSGICELHFTEQFIDLYFFSIYKSGAECYLSDKKYLSSKRDTSFNYLEQIKKDSQTGVASINCSHIGIANRFYDLNWLHL